jgi:hypothetical protein
VDQANPGMVSLRDLMSSHEELLLSKDFRPDASLVAKIKGVDPLGGKMIVYVYDKK